MTRLLTKFLLLACSVGTAMPVHAEITSSHTENQVVDSGYVSFRQKSLFSESEIKVPVPVGPWVVRISDDIDSTGTVRDGHRLVLDMIVNKMLVAQLWLVIYENTNMKWATGKSCEGKFLMQDKSSGANNHCRAGKIVSTYLTNRNSSIQQTLRQAYVRDGISYSTTLGALSGFTEKHNSTALYWFLNIHPALGKTNPNLIYKTEEFSAFLEKALGRQGQSSQLIKVVNGITDGFNKSIIGEDYPASTPTITGPIAFEQLRQGLNELDKEYLATRPTTNPPLSSVMNTEKAESTDSTAQTAVVTPPVVSAEREEIERLKAQLTALQTQSQSSLGKTPSIAANSLRKALVIGNNAYAAVTPLQNARGDAVAIADGLRGVGYSVTLITDATRSSMNAAIRRFKSQLTGGDEVVIFYAGHAVQIQNVNYLLPTDIAAKSEDAIRDDAVELQRILDDVSSQKAKFTVAVIDACRDNPFQLVNGRSIGAARGLSPTTAATGQMIVFSAGTGQQALDNLGANDKEKHGVFTRVFLKHLKRPGIAIDQMVRDVRQEVVILAKSIGHDQVPAVYDQVVGRFYFVK